MITILNDVNARIQTITLHDIWEVILAGFLFTMFNAWYAISFTLTTVGTGLLYGTVFILDKADRKRIIPDRVNEEPYLERYYLLLKDRETFPFNIFIHKFLKSDPDDLHDHPWGFRTIILKGGYWEHTEEGKFWRAPLFTQSVDATYKHRIELKPDVDCWTLFIPYRRERDWGFFKDGKWIQHEKYFADKMKKVE